MILIEALKKIKSQKKKAEDLRSKIKRYCAYKSTETAVYGDQPKQTVQIKEWLQAHSDIIKEVERLTLCIHRTNLTTEVEIELGGKVVKKSIAAWIIRRTELANYDRAAYSVLTDNHIEEGFEFTSNQEKIEVKIVRCYDPKERDNKVALYDGEPFEINSKLEVVNATTTLIED